VREPITAYIGLGSNLRDRAEALRQAVRALGEEDGIRVRRRSAVYETEPLGPAQPRFLNAVVEVQTTLGPKELLETCLAIEQALGRTRPGEPQGPRVVDLDLLLYGDEIVAERELVVPHAHLHTRGFALVPLLEVAGDVRHPAIGRRLSDLLRSVPLAGVWKTEEVL
jgi:2-amino-4-hydroxy-6-hydroxymethyldihydropteridine diphosphokinase